MIEKYKHHLIIIVLLILINQSNPALAYGHPVRKIDANTGCSPTNKTMVFWYNISNDDSFNEFQYNWSIKNETNIIIHFYNVSLLNNITKYSWIFPSSINYSFQLSGDYLILCEVKIYSENGTVLHHLSNGIKIVIRDNADFDGDSIIDDDDAFPTDPSASIDSDSDGMPDSWNPGMGPEDSTTGLTLDPYPNDPDNIPPDDTDDDDTDTYGTSSNNSNTCIWIAAAAVIVVVIALVIVIFLRKKPPIEPGDDHGRIESKPSPFITERHQ